MTASRPSAIMGAAGADLLDTNTTAPEDVAATSEHLVPLAGTPPTIFLHVPKAAGITLRYIAERQYGSHELCKAGHALRNSAQSASLIQEFLRRYGASLRFVEGHLRFGVHEQLPWPATYITLLRDPVERVISHYYFFLAGAEGDAGIDKALAEGSHLIDNLQTRLLSGTASQFGQCSRELPEDLLLIARSSPDFEPCTADMLEAAKRNLREHFSMVGLVESFDASLLLLRRMLGWRDVLYTPENVTESRPQRAQLPRRTILAIERHNRFDRELYNYGRTLFDERCAQEGPEFLAELQAFQAVNRWFGLISTATADSELPPEPESFLAADDEASAALVRAYARVFLLEGEISGRTSAGSLGESRSKSTLRESARVRELQTTFADYKEQRQSRESELADKLERARAAVDALQGEIRDLKAQVREKQEDAARALAALSEQQRQIETVQAHEQELAAQLARAQARATTLRGTNEQLSVRESQYQQQVKQLTVKVDELEQTTARVQEREEAFRAEITWLREQRAWMTERHEDERQQISLLREALSELKDGLAHATAQHAQDERTLAEMNQRIETLRASEAQLQEQVDGLRARADDLHREIEDSRQREAALAERIERLQSQRSELKHHLQEVRPARVASKRS